MRGAPAGDEPTATPSAVGSPRPEVVVTVVDGHRVGFLAASVAEVQPAIPAEPIPDVPAYVEGVINLRGTVAPVVDVRSRFGWPTRAVRLSDCLLVADVAGRPVAFRVDEVVGLTRTELTMGEMGVERWGSTPSACGAAPTDDGLLVVHDLGRFLDADEAALLAAAVTAFGRHVSA